jgi:hypothetical protein
MWELPQTFACRIGQTRCPLEPKPLNKNLHLLSLSRKVDYHTLRKCLSSMFVLISFKDISYNWCKQGKIYGLVSLTFLCLRDVQGMIFSHVQQAAEGGNKKLLCISRHYNVYRH